MWGMYYATVYVVWPQDGYLTTYRQARRTEEPTNTNRRERSMALMTVHALTYTQTRAHAMTEAYTIADTHTYTVARDSKEK